MTDTDEEFAVKARALGIADEHIQAALLARNNPQLDSEPDLRLRRAGDLGLEMLERKANGKPMLTAAKPVHGSACGIPERYWGEPPDQIKRVFQSLKQDAADWLSQMNPGWPGLLFFGGLGFGKTGVAVEFMKFFSGMNRASQFEVLWHMVTRVKQTWGEKEEAHETELQVIQEYVRPDLLVVDEAGVQFGTAAERNILYAVVVSRYNNLKPTIITTNCNLRIQKGEEEFFNSVGTRVADRFQGHEVDASQWGKNLRGPGVKS